MSRKPIHELPPVADDLREAAEFYADWHFDGKAHFFAKYHEAIGWIEHNPDLFPRKIGDVQVVALRQSYYLLYYLQEETRTIILAVLDGRRNPRTINRLVRVRQTFRR